MERRAQIPPKCGGCALLGLRMLPSLVQRAVIVPHIVVRARVRVVDRPKLPPRTALRSRRLAAGGGRSRVSPAPPPPCPPPAAPPPRRCRRCCHRSSRLPSPAAAADSETSIPCARTPTDCASAVAWRSGDGGWRWASGRAERREGRTASRTTPSHSNSTRQDAMMMGSEKKKERRKIAKEAEISVHRKIDQVSRG